MKVGLKWKCKIGTCIIAYCVKWLLTKHLKEVHGLVVQKAKLEGLRHQNHVKMKVRILGDAMALQRRNDQKVVSRVCAKAHYKWDKLIIVTKRCPPLPKPTLIKLVSK
jgi:hypothetical protein